MFWDWGTPERNNPEKPAGFPRCDARTISDKPGHRRGTSANRNGGTLFLTTTLWRFRLNPAYTGAAHVIDANGEPWFVAVDVCRILGIKNTGNAYSRLREGGATNIRRVDVGHIPGRAVWLTPCVRRHRTCH